MKFEYVKKIVEKIQQDIICPKCKKQCTNCPIEIKSIQDNTIDFHMGCPHCNTSMRIAAEIHATQNQHHVSRPRPATHFLSIEKMKNMKQSLQSFQGDVKDLFS